MLPLALIALVIAIAFGLKGSTRIAMVTATLWGVYALYEFALSRRWLCTGECNIRVDLLLIIPILSITSLIALISEVRRRLKRE